MTSYCAIAQKVNPLTTTTNEQKFERLVSTIAEFSRYTVQVHVIADALIGLGLHWNTRADTWDAIAIPSKMAELRQLHPDWFYSPQPTPEETALRSECERYFGPRSNAEMANRLAKENPARYGELKQAARRLGLIP